MLSGSPEGRIAHGAVSKMGKLGTLVLLALATLAAQPAIQRIRVGGAVQAKKLTHSNPPAYPTTPEAARLRGGTVRFNVVIDRSGAVIEANAFAGPAPLVSAARDALLLWRYSPTEWKGVAVEVITVVDVVSPVRPRQP